MLPWHFPSRAVGIAVLAGLAVLMVALVVAGVLLGRRKKWALASACLCGAMLLFFLVFPGSFYSLPA